MHSKSMRCSQLGEGDGLANKSPYLPSTSCGEAKDQGPVSVSPKAPVIVRGRLNLQRLILPTHYFVSVTVSLKLLSR